MVKSLMVNVLEYRKAVVLFLKVLLNSGHEPVLKVVAMVTNPYALCHSEIIGYAKFEDIESNSFMV